MKNKTGRKMLGLLLTLALVLGLMPGMSLTAKAESVQTYKIVFFNIDYNRSKTWDEDTTLPKMIGGSDMRSFMGYREKECDHIDLKSGDNVSIEGTNIKINGEGSSEVWVFKDSSYCAKFRIDVTKNITANATGYDGSYDGQDHSISVNVSVPASGATVRYGTQNGTYNLDQSPKYKDADSYTVYYQVTADGYNTKTGSAEIKIAKIANPISYIETQSVEKTFSTTTQTVNLATATGAQGDVTYSIQSQPEGSYFSINNGTTLTIVANTPAKTYTLTVRATAAGNTNYNEGYKDSTVTVNIGKANASAVTAPTLEVLTYDPAKTLESVTLPTGWAWKDRTTVPTVSNNGYEAALAVDDANYDYTGVVGYDAQSHKVTRTVALTVNKAEVTAPTIASKTYNAQNQIATVPESTLYTVTTNEGGTNVGDYDVVLTLTDSTNYKWTDSEEATKALTFQITQADAPAVDTPTLEAVTYDPAKTLENLALPEAGRGQTRLSYPSWKTKVTTRP